MFISKNKNKKICQGQPFRVYKTRNNPFRYFGESKIVENALVI